MAVGSATHVTPVEKLIGVPDAESDEVVRPPKACLAQLEALLCRAPLVNLDRAAEHSRGMC